MGFILGLWIGGIIGVITMCLFQGGKEIIHREKEDRYKLIDAEPMSDYELYNWDKVNNIKANLPKESSEEYSFEIGV